MGLKATISPASFRKEIDRIKQKTESKVIQLLKRLGVQGVNYARLNKGYTNQTSNLISSIGFTIQVNGIVVYSAFNYENKTAEGSNKGLEFAKRFGLDYPNGYVLIIVAGMDYAMAVEAMGKDVLTGSNIFIKQKLPEMISKLNKVL